MFYFVSLLCALLSAGPVHAQSSHISICSFNIAELGATRENKDHRAIADMIDFSLAVRGHIDLTISRSPVRQCGP